MGAKLMGFSFTLSKSISPATFLLESLRAGFNGFFRPKIGRLRTDDQVLEFGPIPFEQIRETTSLFEGEEIIASELSTLTQQPDATQRIIDFLVQSPESQRSLIQFVGECWLNYVESETDIRGWLFRHGDDVQRYPIMWYDARCSDGTLARLTTYHPWFFLKNWWPEGWGPRRSTVKTAEQNWSRLVNCARLMTDVVGAENLEDLYLNLEGSALYEEREWLIDVAQSQLPNLKIHFA